MKIQISSDSWKLEDLSSWGLSCGVATSDRAWRAALTLRFAARWPLRGPILHSPQCLLPGISIDLWLWCRTAFTEVWDHVNIPTWSPTQLMTFKGAEGTPNWCKLSVHVSGFWSQTFKPENCRYISKFSGRKSNDLKRAVYFWLS